MSDFPDIIEQLADDAADDYQRHHDRDRLRWPECYDQPDYGTRVCAGCDQWFNVHTCEYVPEATDLACCSPACEAAYLARLAATEVTLSCTDGTLIRRESGDGKLIEAGPGNTRKTGIVVESW